MAGIISWAASTASTQSAARCEWMHELHECLWRWHDGQRTQCRLLWITRSRPCFKRVGLPSEKVSVHHAHGLFLNSQMTAENLLHYSRCHRPIRGTAT